LSKRPSRDDATPERAASHVSCHQDLICWGLDRDDQVSMWLALSPTTEPTGCMRMIPGSHCRWRKAHMPTQDPPKVLLQGQTAHGVDASQAVPCPLEPRLASFHHGETLHASSPNRGTDRSAGLNVRDLARHVRQTRQQADTAVLVSGQDRFNHFGHDTVAVTDLDPVAIARQQQLDATYRSIAGKT
jgi:ectoine hydroxylase-related dioxygenase (phytanoyl-CoA dioxygenase family)